MSRRLFATLLVLLFLSGVGQAKEIPLIDFFKLPQFTEAVISPDGRHLALTFPQGAETHVLVMDLKKRKFVSKTSFGKRRHGYDLHWVNNERLLARVGIKTGSFDRLVDSGEIYAFNYDGKRRMKLPQVRSGRSLTSGFGYRVVAWLPTDPEHVIVRKLIGRSPVLYEMNVNNGFLKRFAVSPNPDQLGGYLIDEDGKLWFAWSSDANEHRTLYRFDEKSKRYHKVQFKNLNIDKINFIYPIDENRIWVRADIGRKTYALGILDVQKETIDYKAGHEFVDVDGIVSSLDGRRIIGAKFIPDYPIQKFWDSHDPDVKLIAGLVAAFKGQDVNITSTTADRSKAIVRVHSDRNPGEYYLLDIKQSKVELVAKTRAWINPDDMAEMKPVTIKARDGITLHGYLTVPKGVEAKNLPLIVNPHGGPHGPRDRWGFNPEVQMFANRGYAVLQINFRGSGGYGRWFEELGYRHWGTTMQDDVTDATLWAIKEGIADPKRICIYGASYGGYAALQGAVREPDLYKCAIGYVGVYDLPLMFEDGDIPRTEYGRNYLKKVLGTDENVLKARSPAYNADKIKAAIMLIQGGKDERVPPSQAESMKRALDAIGKPYQWFYSSYSAHGIVDPKTNVALYQKMLKFIRTHIGPGITAH
ncbi:MAG: S9 family peptidase [Gammaproteobacteria bacterium]|nr:MAG: S9 family peptidase [Gammaproteobacteria bacterium]